MRKLVIEGGGEAFAKSAMAALGFFVALRGRTKTLYHQNELMNVNKLKRIENPWLEHETLMSLSDFADKNDVD